MLPLRVAGDLPICQSANLQIDIRSPSSLWQRTTDDKNPAAKGDKPAKPAAGT
jgi:hypothetical protein